MIPRPRGHTYYPIVSDKRKRGGASKTSEEIAADLKVFKKDGGRIQRIPIGLSGEEVRYRTGSNGQVNIILGKG